ncbi:MAG: isoprenylcysteine carboxylmethyltransferase family protein [Candidatus Solibacter sp.]|nr:isoprenylcysteine carboxylmethyltransferase family protein [Candidatus Solibacter sp.]
MISFPKPYADAVARLRVPSGFLIVIVFAWFSRPTPASMAIGIPLSLLGLALRAWAAGCLAKNQQLATGGPYAYTRNPLYIGTLLVAAGLAVASCSIGLAALFTAVFLLVYLPVIQNEEQHLRKIFPGYAEYAKRVPALIPSLMGARQNSPNLFRTRLYLKNQEYKAGLGFLAGMLFLFWKMLG